MPWAIPNYLFKLESGVMIEANRSYYVSTCANMHRERKPMGSIVIVYEYGESVIQQITELPLNNQIIQLYESFSVGNARSVLYCIYTRVFICLCKRAAPQNLIAKC